MSSSNESTLIIVNIKRQLPQSVIVSLAVTALIFVVVVLSILVAIGMDECKRGQGVSDFLGKPGILFRLDCRHILLFGREFWWLAGNPGSEREFIGQKQPSVLFSGALFLCDFWRPLHFIA